MLIHGLALLTLSEQERAQVVDQVTFEATKVIVQEHEQLLLHKVDLRQREEPGVLLPVHVLGRAIIEILGGANEHGKEDAVPSALHAWSCQ